MVVAGVRKAEVLAALSLAIDLGLGLPLEHVLRSSLVASALADQLDLDDDERATVYYANLVVWIGCHADSHEFSRWFGDDLAMRRDSYGLDWSGLPYLTYLLRRTGSEQAAYRRAAMLALLLTTPRARMSALIHSHCQSAGLLADRIGLPASVREAVGFGFERYDGSGLPGGRSGRDIPLPARVVAVAETTEVHLHAYGWAAALAMARDRSGGHFDPVVVDALARCEGALRNLRDEDAWTRALAQAPEQDVIVDDDALDALLEAMGDFADLKCPFTLGHSRAVAALTADAATRLGLGPTDVTRVRRAGHLHDLGRMGVPNSVWEKARPLTGSDRERIRLYPYLTGRVLRRVRGLEAEAAIAEAHRERLDGSGYPRGLAGSALPMTHRLLAAADSYQSSREVRPHRPALDPGAAAERLRYEARTGRFDRDAVEAVLAAAGHRSDVRRGGAAGLTAREVEILGLAARGESSTAIARRLSISPKTVRNHLEHIYTKAGVTNRTGAALFALEHGLLAPEDGVTAP